MDKELALRTFGYLIGHYKTHDETTINKQEIEAIEFMLKNNEDLEQQCKKQKEVIDKLNEVIDKMINDGYSNGVTLYCATGEHSEFGTRAKIIKDILKEVSE